MTDNSRPVNNDVAWQKMEGQHSSLLDVLVGSQLLLAVGWISGGWKKGKKSVNELYETHFTTHIVGLPMLGSPLQSFSSSAAIYILLNVGPHPGRGDDVAVDSCCVSPKNLPKQLETEVMTIKNCYTPFLKP